MLDYAGPPEDLQTFLAENAGDVHLYWKRPSNNGGSKVMDYLVQTRVNKNGIWGDAGNISRLSVTIKNIGNFDQVQIRICSRNKVGIGPLSCTEANEVQIGRLIDFS